MSTSAYYAGRPSLAERLGNNIGPRLAEPASTHRERRARERARDFGCFFCILCAEPIRGLVCYRRGSACHFGCQEVAVGGGALTLESLEPCQEAALQNVREATMTLHHEALPGLRERMARMGFAPGDADTTLAWIRDEAPIVIHIDLAAFGSKLAADTHYRNQFETDTSRGCLSHDTRKRWESNLFDDAYSGASGVDRCKYGVLNVTNDPQGVRRCSNYGTSYLLLRNVRLRTTFAAQDSGGINIAELATVDYYAHVLAKYTDEELRAAVEVGTRRTLGRDSEVIVRYKEAQIHGEVNLAEHVELIMAHPSLRKDGHKEMLRRLSERCQTQVVWIESDGADAGGDTDVADHDVFTSPTIVAEGALPAATEDMEDEELELALAASKAEAMKIAAPSEAMAAEEAREFEEALKLSDSLGSAWETHCGTAAASDGDADMNEAIKASHSASSEDWLRRIDKKQRELQEEEEELARVIQASLAAAREHGEEVDRELRPSLADHEEASDALHGSAPGAPCEPGHNAKNIVKAAGMAMHTVKVSLCDDTRRLRVTWDTKAQAPKVLATIEEAVKGGFGLSPLSKFALKYKRGGGHPALTLDEETVHDFLASQCGPLRIYVEMLDA